MLHYCLHLQGRITATFLTVGTHEKYNTTRQAGIFKTFPTKQN
jgi:hypothetical protein